MSRIGTALVFLTSLAALVILPALPALHAANSLQGPDVTVVNTPANPVPVSLQGTTSISGSVDITGTPNVNVVNSPTVTLAPGSTVSIGNPASAPVLTRDVDSPARQAVTFHDEVSLPAGSLGDVSAGVFTPPAGKRLVIEYVAGGVFLQPGQKALVTVFTSLVSSGFFHPLTVVPQGDFSGLFARPEAFTVNQQLRLYSDAPFPVRVQLQRNDATGSALLQLTFSGYLVDL